MSELNILCSVTDSPEFTLANEYQHFAVAKLQKWKLIPATQLQILDKKIYKKGRAETGRVA